MRSQPCLKCAQRILGARGGWLITTTWETPSPSPGPAFFLLHMPASRMLPHSLLSSRPGAGVLSREQFHLPGPLGCVLAFLAVACDGQWGGMLLASGGRSCGSCLTVRFRSASLSQGLSGHRVLPVLRLTCPDPERLSPPLALMHWGEEGGGAASPGQKERPSTQRRRWGRLGGWVQVASCWLISSPNKSASPARCHLLRLELNARDTIRPRG